MKSDVMKVKLEAAHDEDTDTEDFPSNKKRRKVSMLPS